MPRLLVVEDYPPLATVIAIAFRRSGFDVERFGGIERAHLAAGRFDLAVLDIELLDGSGVDLAGELLASDRVAQVVFFTASRDPALRAEAQRYGELVDKSEGIGQLVAVVESQVRAMIKVVGAPEALPIGRASGRSGTRRRVR